MKNKADRAEPRIAGTSTAIHPEQAPQDIETVLRELRALGLDVVPGSISVSNKPTINSNSGG